MPGIPFTSMKLSQELLRAVHDMGFEDATEIQTKAIPLILDGLDVIGRSQTGTGKTAAFAIPAVELADGENKADVQILVICPTRELAMQSWGEFKKIYKYKSGVKAAAIFGGQQIDRQISELKKGVNVVIGTPGRILDHLRRKTLKLGSLKMVVLDEADEMLDMGFREDIETILDKTPPERQTVLFSATMPPEILAITKTYQKQPRLVEIRTKQVTLAAVRQYYCEVPANDKPEALIELLKRNEIRKSIVFCNTQRMVDQLCRYLNQNGHEAAGIHGSMRQNVRTQVMKSFKAGKSALLIATDVAARGIDAQDVEAVINFDIPPNTEYYIHRIGRTGRAGKAGMAFTIACGRAQVMQLRNIERATKAEIIFQDIPIEGRPSDVKGKPWISDAAPFPGTEQRTQKSAVRPQKDGIEPKSDRRAPKADTARIVLNLGKEQHVEPGHIVKAIAEKTSLSGSDIGKIQILGKSTVVEIPDAHKQEVLDALKGSKMLGMFVQAGLYDGGPQTGKTAPGSAGRFGKSRRTGNQR
jgi:Superfamily II DNA and RNA helicases